MKKSYIYLKQVIFYDVNNRYLFLTTTICGIVDLALWYTVLVNRDVAVYLKFSIYPVKLLGIMLVLNTALALFSYFKEKEISYLLFMANIILVVFTLVLEIFYLFNS